MGYPVATGARGGYICNVMRAVIKSSNLDIDRTEFLDIVQWFKKHMRSYRINVKLQNDPHPTEGVVSAARMNTRMRIIMSTQNLRKCIIAVLQNYTGSYSLDTKRIKTGRDYLNLSNKKFVVVAKRFRCKTFCSNEQTQKIARYITRV